MSCEDYPGSRCVLLLLLLMPATAALASDFKPPALDGYELRAERDADGDGDGVKESHIRQYLDTAGDSIISMSTNARTWAWSLNTSGSETGDKNYVIRDSDCDGIYDEVYSLDDRFYVPDCLK